MSDVKHVSKFTKTQILLVSSLTVMAGATIAPSLPQIAKEFSHINKAEFLAKLMLTIPALSIVIFAPLAGYLVDKLGRLKVLYPGLLLYAVSGSIGYFIHDIYIILAGRFLLGMAVAAIMTTAITLAGDYMKGKELANFIGIQAAVMSAGGAVFVGAGGYLADIDWSLPFLIYLFSIVVMIGSSFFLFEPEEESHISEEMSISYIQDIKNVFLIFIVAFFSMVIFYLIPVQLPFFLKEIGIQKNSMVGNAIVIATLGSFTTGMSYGRLRKSMSINYIFIIIFLFMSIGIGMIAFSYTFLMVAVSMIVAGLGLGLLMPNLNNWLLQSTQAKNRGRLSGFLSASLFLGQFMSPILAAPIIKWTSISNMFLVAAMIVFVVAVFFIFRGRVLKTRAARNL